MSFRFQQRRRTSAAWAVQTNDILLDGEIGIEEDTNKFKIGDGATPWNQLDYFIPRGAIEGLLFDAIENITAGPISEEIALQLLDHVNHPEPHPAYDDIPSFALKWTNVIT